jgi:hypothetical protein
MGLVCFLPTLLLLGWGIGPSQGIYHYETTLKDENKYPSQQLD